MKFFNKQKNKLVSGFTLIETMVAVFILSIALVSLLSLTSKSLFSARYARNEITANYLLQEAVDYIRNQRDSVAFLQSDTTGSWDIFLQNFEYPGGACFIPDKGCYFDVNKNSLNIGDCNGECPLLNYDEEASDGSFYNYDASVPSNFRRTIKLELDTADELFILVTVEWFNGNLVQSRSLYTSLLNWLPN